MGVETEPRQPARAGPAHGVRQHAAEGYVLERQVGHLLRRAHQRHAALFQTMLAEALGAESVLTPTQWAALFTLATRGDQTQNALGRLVAMDPATTQGVVRRLVARRTDSADRRTVRLSVTEAGRATVAAALPTAAAISEATLSPLSPEERLTFLHLLQRMAFA